MDHIKQKNNTKMIAIGGVLLALTLVCLYAASFVPAMELSLYALSSIFVPAMMIETKGKGGWILYIACSILSLLILPNKIGAIPYIFFFGIYGIIKYYIEKIPSPVVQVILKLTVFTAIMLVFYNFFYSLFFGVISLPDLPILAILAGGEVLFILYDALLTLIITYYYNSIHGRI
ncbi:hypothetical protein [Clostridium aminobutyricum]|uniref:Uncharacterized protein n=1 Tax=Clostridium aminobutyricum TaxID=33953 RepID=A0A939DB05_CLOAM|nr:hypothetical protein [Clostridium aminobutyricum]MBN7774624.1 hypothetical protein [Clostridium aminobutyricum]